MKKEQTVNNYIIRIKRVYQRLNQMLNEPIDLQDLAQTANFSLYHFHRIYRAITGENVAETHRRLRLERAAAQLVRSKRSITDIALEAGYETSQAFSRAFRMQFDCSPSMYRKHNLNNLVFPQYPCLPITMEHIIMNINIVERPQAIVYGLHHKGPYIEIAPVFEQVWQFVREHQLATQVKAGLGIYYSDPLSTKPEECLADVCIQLEGKLPEDMSPLQKIEIAAGRFACYRHIGPYNAVQQVYSMIYSQWLPKSGYEAADKPPFEIYVNNPRELPPEEWITDIYIPIE